MDEGNGNPGGAGREQRRDVMDPDVSRSIGAIVVALALAHVHVVGQTKESYPVTGRNQ